MQGKTEFLVGVPVIDVRIAPAHERHHAGQLRLALKHVVNHGPEDGVFEPFLEDRILEQEIPQQIRIAAGVLRDIAAGISRFGRTMGYPSANPGHAQHSVGELLDKLARCNFVGRNYRITSGVEFKRLGYKTQLGDTVSDLGSIGLKRTELRSCLFTPVMHRFELFASERRALIGNGRVGWRMRAHVNLLLAEPAPCESSVSISFSRMSNSRPGAVVMFVLGHAG